MFLAILVVPVRGSSSSFFGEANVNNVGRVSLLHLLLTDFSNHSPGILVDRLTNLQLNVCSSRYFERCLTTKPSLTPANNSNSTSTDDSNKMTVQKNRKKKQTVKKIEKHCKSLEETLREM